MVVMDNKGVIKYIQVFGLQCSGTNIVTQLLRENFDGEVSERFGSKHGVEKSIRWDEIESLKDEALFVHIYKNIYAWIVSMRNNTYGAMPAGLNIANAMATKWAPKGSKHSKTFPNILLMRQNVMETFLKVKASVPNWENIEHDEFVENPQKIVEDLRLKYNLWEGKIDLRVTQKYKGKAGRWRKRSYYVNKKYMAHFPPYLKNLVDERYDNTKELLLCQ